MEKIKHNRFSKVLVLLMAVMMVLTMMPNGMGGTTLAWAAEENGNLGTVTQTVYASLQIPNENSLKNFAVSKTAFSVNSGLAESYGYVDNVDKTNNVSALDVLVALVKQYKGDDKVSENLSVSSSGMVTLLGSDLLSFAVDGLYPSDGVYNSTYRGYTGSTINSTILYPGQYVEFFMYDQSYSDDYSWFEQNGKRVNKLVVEKDKPISATLKGYPYANTGYKKLEWINDVKSNIAGVKVSTLDSNGLAETTTKANGDVDLTFTKTGNYIVSAQIDESQQDGPEHTEACGHIIVTMEMYYDMDSEYWNADDTAQYCVYDVWRNSGADESTALKNCECSCCAARATVLGNSAAVNQYSGKLIRPTLEVKVVDALSDQDKADNIAESIDWSVIQGENDIVFNVSSDLVLPTNVDSATVTWASDKTNVIANDGKLTIPEPYQGGGQVKLTATVQVGTAVASRDYYLNVYEKAAPITVYTDAQQDKIISEIINNFGKLTGSADGVTLLSSDSYRDYVVAASKAGATLTEEQKKSVYNRILYDLDISENSVALGTWAKDVLALTAIGIDVTKITVDGKSYNLLEKIYNAKKACLDEAYAVYKIPYILAAYGAHPNYTIPDNANITKKVLIDKLAALQKDNGGWDENYASNADNATLVFALYNYKNDAELGAKVNQILTKTSMLDIPLTSPTAVDNGSAYNNAQLILKDSLFAQDARSRAYDSNSPDLIDALLHYKVGEYSNWFKGYSGSKDVSSTVEAYKALVAYRLFKDGATQLYDFSGTTIQGFNVNKTPILSDLFVTPPHKTSYLVGDKLDTTGMVVIAKYNDGSSRIVEDGYTVNKKNEFSKGQVGTYMVTVTYEDVSSGIKIAKSASFNVIVSNQNAQETQGKEVTTSVKNAQGTAIASGTTIIKEKSTTVMDVLRQVLAQAGKTATIDNGYVRSIDGVGEFDYGGNSGWMVRVDGKLIEVSAAAYKLNGGETIEWFYTNDWTTVPGAMDFMKPETKSDVTTSGASGSAITTAPTDVKVSEKTNADGTKETVAAVKVDSKHHDEIIKQAAENKSAEIVLEVSQTDSKGADNVQLTLDTAFIKKIFEKTAAKLTVDTQNGRMTFDREAIKTLCSEAKGDTITIEAVKISQPTEAQKKAAGANAYLFKLIVKSGGKSISDFNKGSAQVRLALPSALLDKKTAAIHIAEDGTIEQFAGKVLTISGKKYYEFTTPHFSTFALVDAEEAGLDVVDEQTVDAKALAAKLTPAARSAKTTKKNVRVKLSLDKQDKEILNQLADAGYTVRYRFYRSTKKAAGYKAAVTKKTMTYTNTTGKQGTKYFYKVQIRVYDKNGKLAAKTALKQCRYACRNWTK